MQIVINHPNGKQYRLPASQVVIYSDDGYPVGVSYEHANLIVHTDRSHKDFDQVLDQLKIQQLKAEA